MEIRNDFFATESNRQELENLSADATSSNRWLAAIKLSEIHEEWAAKLLWKLKVDEDSNTRAAAIAALKKFPEKLLSSLHAKSEAVPARRAVEVWKSGILPVLSKDSREEYEAAVLSILQAEGPTTGGRVQRLIQKASQPSGGGKLTQAKLKPLLENLLRANEVTRADEFFDSENLDLWILHIPTDPELIVRTRNERLLTEIPVNEARQVLREDPRVQRRADNKEVAFAVLRRHYEIDQNELFLVGEALEGQWRNLFR